MRKKYFGIIAAVIIIATVILAVIFKNMQDESDALVIRMGDEEWNISQEELDQQEFAGELIDGKGDVTSHEYRGVLLRKLLTDQEISLTDANSVVVTSADQFSAEFTVDEIVNADHVYLAVWADGTLLEDIDGNENGVQCIVFYDSNSRRCVRFTSLIEVK